VKNNPTRTHKPYLLSGVREAWHLLIEGKMHWLEGVIIIGAGFIPFLIVLAISGRPAKRQDLEVRLPWVKNRKTYVRNGGFPLASLMSLPSWPYEVASSKTEGPMPAGTGASLGPLLAGASAGFQLDRSFLRWILHLGDGASSPFGGKATCQNIGLGSSELHSRLWLLPLTSSIWATTHSSGRSVWMF